MKVKTYLMLIIGSWVALAGSSLAQEAVSNKVLVQALQKGGYNIYFRHAGTDWTRQDQVAEEGDWKSCDPDKMRQLVAEGRATARRIGAAIRRLNIPVGRVWSSEYCRARETARHLDLGPITTTHAIMNMRAAAFVGGREALIDRARRALSTPPPEGTNTVFVAHGNLVQAATGAYPGEAGAAIFAPLGKGELRLVAMLDPGDWKLLADGYISDSR